MPGFTRLAAAMLVAAAVFSSPAYASSQDSSQEQPAFVQTGNLNGNAAVAYDAAASGTLTQPGSRSTGGLGGQLGGALGGTWGSAEEVPGTATLNQGGDAVTNSVSCAAARNCTAGGYYTDNSGHSQAFVVSET